ncbi:centrosomal protein of 290 kDa [Sitophilus oryzae]|uniref:Centrosomal protein of 290 kDa n=1 Tax=Sitophilus oryzae TaxID=7048 RepID=A0A6J2X5W6_SITOR|nr:centrosomal protein of 290 kDa [Sitophilus oryzae]
MTESASTIEYENLEQKYVEIKRKFKKTIENNEKLSKENSQLTKKLSRLERDNAHLENQIRNMETSKDNSESESSASTALVEKKDENVAVLIQSKNRQISDLLNDLEEVEKENLSLREKLVEVKNELSQATEEISSILEVVKSKEAALQEKNDELEKSLLEIAGLRELVEHHEIDKVRIEKEFKQFSLEINEKIDQWKAVLDKKNAEIAALKNEKPTTIRDISSPEDGVTSDIPSANIEYCEKLRTALQEAETQVERLKLEMEDCTAELKESAEAIVNLKMENEKMKNEKGIIDEENSKLKGQLKKSRDRCKKFQIEVDYANKISNTLESELKKIQDTLKEDGQLDFAEILSQSQSIKVQLLTRDKRIAEMVQDLNTLQESHDYIEIENRHLKNELGLDEEEVLQTDLTMLPKKRRNELKTIEKMKKSVESSKEENIKLRMEILNLNKKFTSLMSKDEVDYSKHRPNEDLKALSEENEALRNGLHEILTSVRQKDQEISPREIKSEILEKLLRALDVKHISGWYHPAMRLQAELHNLEGVNSELREQLRDVRSELENLKISEKESIKQTIQNEDVTGLDNRINITDEKLLKISPLLKANYDNIQEIKISILKIIANLYEDDENIENNLENEFSLVQNRTALLHEKCFKEKQTLIEELNKKHIENEEKVIDLDLNSINSEEIKSLLLKERKKVKNLLNENILMEDKINLLKSEIGNIELNRRKQIEVFLKKIARLRIKLKEKDLEKFTFVDQKAFKETEKSLDECLVKYRKLLRDVEDLQNGKSLELSILTRNEEDLRKENTELKERYQNLSCQLQDIIKTKELSLLTEKLGIAEMQAVKEKNRADHMSNLYDLVKEQLRKSEEKLLDFSKQVEGLAQKNLALQAQIRESQSEVVSNEILERFQELKLEFENLTKEQEKEVLIEDKETFESDIQKWDNQKHQQLLELKHQIIDLTASSDDKYQIQRLHYDLGRYKSSERDWSIKINRLEEELTLWKNKFDEISSQIEKVDRDHQISEKMSQKKVSDLRRIIKLQHIQFYGNIPLSGEEIFVGKLLALNKEQHAIFLKFQQVKTLKNNLLAKDGKHSNSIDDGIQTNDLEQKDDIIQFFESKIELQNHQIIKLEQELLSTLKSVYHSEIKQPHPTSKTVPKLIRQVVVQESMAPTKNHTLTIHLLKNQDCQTEQFFPEPKETENEAASMLKTKIRQLEGHMTEKNQLIIQKDFELGELKRELNEEKSRVVGLNRKLQDLEDNNNRIRASHAENGAGDGIAMRNQQMGHFDEQIVALRAALSSTKDNLNKKELEIIKYQTLLKEDRDKHSFAAANLDQELKVLQKTLLLEQQKRKNLEQMEILSNQKTTAVEKYVSQVHLLEGHLAELHTRQAKMEVQLHTAQQEAARWREMAQDRLVAIEELGKNLDEQHQKELTNYKTDYQKLKDLAREETPRKEIVKEIASSNGGVFDPDVLKLFREKDERIKELTAKLKQVQTVDYRSGATDSQKANISKENEFFRKKYDGLLEREKSLQEEIKNLREQLSKKQAYLTQKPSKTIKDQLQKKIALLETEVENLKQELTDQKLLNERHKLSVAENFGKWKKQKFWQENCEKFKAKLQEREEELSKFQQTCSGHKLLIDRLEREKHNLENKIKSLKSDHAKTVPNHEIAMLKLENRRLYEEVENLRERIESLHQGAGALGAAIMQEKLEAQERKIAVLELSTKGNIEVRNELERLHSTLSNLQKTNLCLEAENLELKMDLEKHTKETPHLQEQIQHLESYIEVLKSESEKHECASPVEGSSEDRRVTQLERTVFILKRVVEKLQVENKRLVSEKTPNFAPPILAAQVDVDKREQTVLPGENVSYMCRVAVPLQYYDEPIDELPMPAILELAKEHLLTKVQNLTRKLRASDNGKFLRCVAYHPAYPGQVGESKRRLDIKYAPLPQGQTIEAYDYGIGKTGEINVTVEANPRPSFEWTVDGQRIREGSHDNTGIMEAEFARELGNGRYLAVLRIARIGKQDTEKVYILKAYNDQGSQEYRVKISTNSEPKGTFIYKYSSADKLKRDYARLKEQHAESLQKIQDLQTQISKRRVEAKTGMMSQRDQSEQFRIQLEQVKNELEKKSHLLDKVKALLHGAAAKEKLLLKEIAELKTEKSNDNFQRNYRVDVPSPIEELSEESTTQ